LRRRRHVAGERVDEGVLGVELQRAVVAALEADGGGGVGRQATSAHRPGVVGGIEEKMVGQSEQPVGQRSVQRARHRLDGLVALGVEVGASRVADEQGVAGEHEPRLVTAGVVGHEVGVVRGRVAGGGDRLQVGVAQADDLSVGERVMLELDPGALREIGLRAGAGGESGEAGDVVGLQVRLEDGHDRGALCLGRRDVLADEIDMRVDHGERAVRLAPEEIGGAGRVVVQQLSEVHAGLRVVDVIGLTSYQVIY
jgi:hypothetical protein